MTYSAVEVITAKRDGLALDDGAIDWILSAYLDGAVADEQMAALLMAIFFNGLDDRELATFTARMIASGERLDLSGLSRPTVDKHSTGGVGDKVSLILCPLVAACGAAVPQLSGRGLGHTGGTLDKLESIPGWRARLTNAEVLDQLERVGAVICAAGEGLAPVDRRLYALRDVTGTVESIPLIASSIMSKKIAEGTSALVLDVKVGAGAFIKDRDRARALAATMVALGGAHGVRTRAQLTDMSTPLGVAVGNALEVSESVDVLRGAGPADVRELTIALARHMLELVGIDDDPAARLDDGSAYAAWRDLVAAQGGDPDAEMPRAPLVEPVLAPRGGVVERLDALAVGIVAWRLGAGRARKEDPVSARAGVRCLVRPGDVVEAGQPLLELHADDRDHLASGREVAVGAVTLGEGPAAAPGLLYEVVEGGAR
ncbi:MAG TPA: thymidine phosphorylase [Acidimicrobiales bacterium]|nr:thymidine phosphorylase [Acidimicrobiales bacterium]